MLQQSDLLVLCQFTSHYDADRIQLFHLGPSILVNSRKIAACHASGLRSCWLDYPDRSVFHAPRQEAWPRSRIHGPGWSLLQVSPHFMSLLTGSFDVWHPWAFFLRVPHLLPPRCMYRRTCTTVKRADRTSLVSLFARFHFFSQR